MKRLLLILGAVGLTLAGLLASGASAPLDAQDDGDAAVEPSGVQVRLEPRVTGVADVVRLTVSIDGEALAGRTVGEPTFELENLDLVGGPSRQESLSIVNGKASRTFALSWFLKPRETGTAGVSKLRVPLGDRVLELPDQTVEVQEESVQPPRSRADRRDSLLDEFESMFDRRRRPRDVPEEPARILLRARLEPERPWEGQQVTYTLDLLVERRRPGEGRARVESIFPRELPEFSGFWSQEIDLPDSVRPEVVEIDGRTYWSQPVLKRALFPLRDEERTIAAAGLDLRVVYYQPTMFGEEPTLPRDVAVTSNPVTVSARGLPPSPDAFSGLVGHDLRVRADVEPAVLEADEAATLTLHLTGEGHFSGIADPRLEELDGLSVQPPAKSSDRSIARERVRETRTWHWTLVPEREGRWSIPPLSWTYFDPNAGEYRTASSEAIRLAAAGPSAPTPEPASPSDAVPARPAPGPEATVSGETPVPEAPPRDTRSLTADLVALPWPNVFAVGAVLALLAGLILVLRVRTGTGRRRLVHRLRDLPDDSPRSTASAAEEAWRDYLQEHWDLPPGLPCRQWPEHLRSAGADKECAQDLVALMDDLHYLRYAPQLASADALRSELLPRSRRILKRLG